MALYFFLVVHGLVPGILHQAIAADQRRAVRARTRHPPILVHRFIEALRVFVGDLSDDLASELALAALEEGASFHYCVSPAAGNTGVMSTGMSFSLAMTPSISGFDTPYLLSKRCARA